jgi:2-haloacid dehalogenase
MKYKWILFDADNTLFDYDKGEASALKMTFEQLGFSFKPEYLDVYKQVNHDIWQELEPAVFSEHYLNNLSLTAELIDGAQEIVESLHGRVGMLIITNGLQAVQRPRLERSVLKSYIKDIIISEEVGSGKPDTPIFDTAFARMGSPAKEEVLIVGDSLTSDIRGGLNYGIDTCWFNPAQKEENPEIKSLFQIKTLDELVNIIKI